MPAEAVVGNAAVRACPHGRIEGQPAVFREIDFDPGVLVHRAQVEPVRLRLSRCEAGRDARGQARDTAKDRHGRCEHVAVTFPVRIQEVADMLDIFGNGGRGEGVYGPGGDKIADCKRLVDAGAASRRQLRVRLLQKLAKIRHIGVGGQFVRNPRQIARPNRIGNGGAVGVTKGGLHVQVHRDRASARS